MVERKGRESLNEEVKFIVTWHHEAPHQRDPKQINALPTVRGAKNENVVLPTGFALLVKNFRKSSNAKTVK